MRVLITLLLLACLPIQLPADNLKTQINTGDKQLNTQLIELNNKHSTRLKAFSRKISQEYMLPLFTIEDMIRNYDFKPADIFLTAAIADLSGQPVNNISRAYIENKQQGWRFTLQRINILSSTAKMKQLRQDARLYIKN